MFTNSWGTVPESDSNVPSLAGLTSGQRSSMAELILLQRSGLQQFTRIPFGNRKLVQRRLITLEAWLRPWSVFQRYLDRLRAEWNAIDMYLPATVHAAVDLGCGMGGIDEFVVARYQTVIEKVYLVDLDGIDRSIRYGFGANSGRYGRLDLTVAYLTARGVPLSLLNKINVEVDALPSRELQLVLSFKSWGFHYPIETYLEYVGEHLSRDGVVITDVRHGTDGLDRLRDLFSVRAISREANFDRVVCSRA